MDISLQKKIMMDDSLFFNVYSKLEHKVIAFRKDIWSDLRDTEYRSWLDNFKDGDIERLNALYLLSKFVYFGHLEINTMLQSMYRDLYKYPIVAKIREHNNNTLDDKFIKKEFHAHLMSTRFFGVGEPSESGVHLLYYFRQQNNLPESLFINTHELFTYKYKDSVKQEVITWSDPTINHVVFIDDFCGGGTQAIRYIKKTIEIIKDLNSNCEVDYFVLVANEAGLNNVRENTQIDKLDAVFILDESFKCFSEKSRYYANVDDPINKEFTKGMCEKYGKERSKDAGSAMGYSDNQLLLSFFHNTPNNTLPIFWSDAKGWYPMFKREIKRYK